MFKTVTRFTKNPKTIKKNKQTNNNECEEQSLTSYSTSLRKSPEAVRKVHGGRYLFIYIYVYLSLFSPILLSPDYDIPFSRFCRGNERTEETWINETAAAAAWPRESENETKSKRLIFLVTPVLMQICSEKPIAK